MAIIITPSDILRNGIRIQDSHTGVTVETLPENMNLPGFVELANPETSIGRGMQRLIATAFLQGGVERDRLSGWLTGAGESAREALCEAAGMRFESEGPALSWNERNPDAQINPNTFTA